jgi:hypothetical protein
VKRTHLDERDVNRTLASSYGPPERLKRLIRSGGVEATARWQKDASGNWETLLPRGETPRKLGRPYNRKNGKWADGSRVADGLDLATTVGNATRAMEPCCFVAPPTTREAGTK